MQAFSFGTKMDPSTKRCVNEIGKSNYYICFILTSVIKATRFSASSYTRNATILFSKPFSLAVAEPFSLFLFTLPLNSAH